MAGFDFACDGMGWVKGWALRLRRQLLRIQQEDVLNRIVRKAVAQFPRGFSAAKPVPNKFMVQFLEKASIEEITSPLVDLWANLLAFAATNYDPNFVHFSSIISQMSASQASILKSVIGSESAHDVELAGDDIAIFFAAPKFREYLSEQIAADLPDVASIDDADVVGNLIEKRFNRLGIEVVYIGIEANEDFVDFIPDYQTYDDKQSVDYAILEAIGLILRSAHDDLLIGSNILVSVVFYYLTELGRHFAMACRLVR